MRPEILHQKRAFVSSRGVEELECTVPRKKIGGTSEFFSAVRADNWMRKKKSIRCVQNDS
jgi:hypothetical protein